MLVADKYEAMEGLLELGFETETDPEKIREYSQMSVQSNGAFMSLRFGDVNYIITDDVFFFERFLTGAYVAKKLNLMRKEDRVLVHAAVRGATYAVNFYPDFEISGAQWVRHRQIEDAVMTQVFNSEIDAKMEDAVDRSLINAEAQKNEQDCPF